MKTADHWTGEILDIITKIRYDRPTEHVEAIRELVREIQRDAQQPDMPVPAAPKPSGDG